MDLGLAEYALWVSIGLWATLFVDNTIARVAGVVLIVLAILRALTEKDRAAQTTPTPASEPPGDPDEAVAASPSPARQRRRIL